MIIHQALIMAAGYATRMRPLTDTLPKPLLKVGGKPLLTHIIDHLVKAGVTTIVINGYHAIAALKDYMTEIRKEHPDLTLYLSQEESLLDTGGGAVKAMEYLDRDVPFYMINGDAFWVDATDRTTLQTLAESHYANGGDLTLLLQSIHSMSLTGAVGDYDIDLDTSLASRSLNKTGEYMFTGIRVCHPQIMSPYSETCFSFLEIMDALDKKDGLYGCPHRGDWYHISTPEDLDDVNKSLFGIAA